MLVRPARPLRAAASCAARSARPMRSRPARRCCTRGRDRVLAADPRPAQGAPGRRRAQRAGTHDPGRHGRPGHRPRPARRWQRGAGLTPREPLRRAWALLGEHGLRVRADRAADAGTRGRRAAARTRRSALAGCRAIRSLATPQWAPTRVSRWRPVWRWTAIACAIWLGGLNLYATQLRGESPLIDTDARTSAEGLPQAARGAGSRAPGAPGAGRAARQTGFVVGRRLPAAGARHGPGHALRRRPRRACPTPTTPSR